MTMPLMEQGVVEAQDRGFLPAMLGIRTGEHAARLADQGALYPQTSGGIEELPHLPAHVAKAGGGAEDDRIGSSQFLHRADGHLRLRFLRRGCAHLFQHRLGKRFRDPPQLGLGPFNQANPFRDTLRHFVDVAVH
jgi:hypothetical protein